MKKNLLKILACSAVVAMVASCGGKTPADSSSTSSEDPGIQYLDVSMQEINAIESDGSYSLEGQYVQFSNAAVSGAYADVVYVNCQEVTYYSDLIGVEVHQLEPGEFDYKDVVSVKGKVASEDGRVFIEEAEVTLEEAGAGSVYTWSNYFNRTQYDNQFNKTYSGFPIFGINLQLATLPDLDALEAGEETEFYVTFPGEDLDMEDLDNSCPFRVLVPAGLADETIEGLLEYFDNSVVGDVIELDSHMFYSQTAGGLGLILDDVWTTIDDGSAVVLDEWADAIEMCANGLQVALPNIGIDNNENLISYVPDDTYFHTDINNFASWQIAKIPSADRKDFGAFETIVNVKSKNLVLVLADLVEKADALQLGGNWVKDNDNTDVAKKEYAYDLIVDDELLAVLTIEKSSEASLCVDFFAKSFPWTAFSILKEVALTMGLTEDDIDEYHDDFGRLTSVRGGYYYSYDTIIDTLALELLPDGAECTVDPHDVSEEVGYDSYDATFEFEGFVIDVYSKAINGLAKPASYIYFEIWESTNVTTEDQDEFVAAYEARVDAFFGTDDFETAIPTLENIDLFIFDYYYESYYESRFETTGEFTDYELTLLPAEDLGEGDTITTVSEKIVADLIAAGFVEKYFTPTKRTGLYKADTNEFVMVDIAEEDDEEIFVEIYNLSAKAAEQVVDKVTEEFENFADAKAEYVARADSKAARLGVEGFSLTSALPELTGADLYVTSWANEGDYDAYFETYGLMISYSITATFGEEANLQEIFIAYREALLQEGSGFEMAEFNGTVGMFNATTNEFVALGANTTKKTITISIIVFDDNSKALIDAFHSFKPEEARDYLIDVLSDDSVVAADPVEVGVTEQDEYYAVWNDNVNYWAWYISGYLMKGGAAYSTWTMLGYDFDGEGVFDNMTYFYIVYSTYEGTYVMIRLDKVDETTMSITAKCW